MPPLLVATAMAVKRRLPLAIAEVNATRSAQMVDGRPRSRHCSQGRRRRLPGQHGRADKVIAVRRIGTLARLQGMLDKLFRCHQWFVIPDGFKIEFWPRARPVAGAPPARLPAAG